MRFMSAAVCAGHGRYRLDGDARMRQRPIGGLVDALRDLGAMIGYEEREGFCPLTIHARGLRGGRARFDNPPSSQFVSALLMVAPLATNDVFIVAENLPSASYVKLTMSVMAAFGVSAVEDVMTRFIVPAGQSYRATQLDIEPDASAATYFFAAAAITGGRVTADGLGQYSIQGDLAFIDLLERMGCRAERSDRAITIRGPHDGRLQGIDADLNAMPDAAPTLAVLAAFAEGPTRIRGVPNLRIKESDRLAALATGLDRIGVPTEIHEDGLTIRPAGQAHPARIETYDDHRIAMAFAVAGLRLNGLSISNPACVAKTFPEFFDLWDDLSG